MTTIRDWVGLQKEMLQEIGAMLSILLLTVNLGLTVFLLIRSEDGWLARPEVVVPVVVVAIGLGVWLFARAWHFVGMMHKSKQRALVVLNPFMTTDFTPHEWMLWKYVSIPTLESNRHMMAKLGLDTKEVDERIAMVERWLEAGQIPKEEFPPRFTKLLRGV